MVSIISLVIGIVIGGVLTYVTFGTSDKNDSEGPPTVIWDGILDKMIPNSEAMNMIENHVTNNPSDSISGHIELATLVKYMAYVQDASNSSGVTVSGLEFYFSRYDGIENNDLGQLTYLVYPTYLTSDEEGTEIHVPFDPVSSTPGNVVSVMDLKDGRNADNIIALNKSNMSPPRRRCW